MREGRGEERMGRRGVRIEKARVDEGEVWILDVLAVLCGWEMGCGVYVLSRCSPPKACGNGIIDWRCRSC